MKKYKNSLLSLSSYVLAFVLVCWAFASEPHLGATPDYLFYVLWTGFILIPVGIFFALRSDMRRESSWSGNLLMILGVLLLFPVDFYWSLGDLGQSSAIVMIVLALALIILIIRMLRCLSKKKGLA